MAKDKRKKKFFQGMEHLHTEIENTTTKNDIKEELKDSPVLLSTLKKDLLSVILLMSLFVLILIILMVFDKTSSSLTIFAGKITSLFIK